MEFKGRYLIPASPETVWAALNDPDILRQCVPGCESLEKTDPTHFRATATLKIGPVKATFKANLALENVEAPTRCTLKGEGQGGVAGFARGTADIVLTPGEGGTSLSYTAQAAIGGKLAQIGQRLIDGAVKQTADDFFARFREAVAQRPAPEPLRQAAPAPAEMPRREKPQSVKAEPRGGLAPEVWTVGLIAIIAALLVAFGALFP